MLRWLNNNIPKLWDKRNALTYALLPLSFAFRSLSALRRQVYSRYWASTIAVPVIVVGNLTVGGTGKTPFVIWLAKALKEQGFFPGIITRGYKAKSLKGQIRLVDDASNAYEVGDEAILLAKHTACPVAVGRKRVSAANLLLKRHPEINIIISDDGLQHYTLSRDIEIAIVDGQRQWGNGFCLPAGPLREPVARLQSVDFVVTNGGKQAAEWRMNTILGDTVNQVNSPEHEISIFDFATKKVHAVAGIGSPSRFFNALKEKGIEIIEHAFPDHYFYQKQDLIFNDLYPILMTEKDAVKCQSIVSDNAWFINIQVSLPEGFISHIIRRLTDGQKTARHTRLSDLQATRYL